MKCNQCRPGFELVSPCPFPRTITITPYAAPKLLDTVSADIRITWLESYDYVLLSKRIISRIYIRRVLVGLVGGSRCVSQWDCVGQFRFESSRQLRQAAPVGVRSGRGQENKVDIYSSRLLRIKLCFSSELTHIFHFFLSIISGDYCKTNGENTFSYPETIEPSCTCVRILIYCP